MLYRYFDKIIKTIFRIIKASWIYFILIFVNTLVLQIFYIMWLQKYFPELVEAEWFINDLKFIPIQLVMCTVITIIMLMTQLGKMCGTIMLSTSVLEVIGICILSDKAGDMGRTVDIIGGLLGILGAVIGYSLYKLGVKSCEKKGCENKIEGIRHFWLGLIPSAFFIFNTLLYILFLSNITISEMDIDEEKILDSFAKKGDAAVIGTLFIIGLMIIIYLHKNRSKNAAM